MAVDSKTRLYKTCARPIMTNAIETRDGNATTKRLLRITEMRTLTGITGCSMRDHIRIFRCGEMGPHQKKRVEKSCR